ncbi:MAG: hypothetical protein NVSMB16_07050 [Acidimicrobiales bacterium]
MLRFATWLRVNAERYLKIAAEDTIARKYGHVGPVKPKGLLSLFFLSVFVPVYRRLPWKVRTFVIHALPGSHRQNWTPRDRHTRRPAV